ncbi:MAG: hypothetical protein FJ388_01660 [Verrucomicrobia bacterium]|nr:hypothetical protein [Verrucomicrobiota bacterium]
MSLTSEARAELAAMIANDLAEFAVPVVIAGQAEVTGLSVQETQSTDFSGNGETGMTTGRVRISGEATKPTRGATILVNGKSVVVTQVDGSGALWVIDYRRVREVEGV